MTKYKIGEIVRFLGHTHNMYNEFGEIVYIDDSKPIVLYTLKFGFEIASSRIVYIADVRESQMNKKEKEVRVKPEDIICHPLDPRVEGLIGTKVVMGDHMSDFGIGFNIRVRPLTNVVSGHEYPFNTGIVCYKFIAPYVEPEKKYRPFSNDELRNMLGTKLCMKKNYRSVVRIAEYIQDETGYAHIRFHCGFEPDAQEILDNWTFIDGSPCGVRE